MRKVKQFISELGPKNAPETVVESGEARGVIVSSKSNTKNL